MSEYCSTASGEAALSALARDPNIRILRRVAPLADFPIATGSIGAVRRIAVVDTETTGFDTARDEIIDIAAVMIEVDAGGEIVRIGPGGQSLRDPGFPIPEAISRLTGLTDADVAGRTVDVEKLEHFMGDADVRLAHNAAFDIGFIEALAPGLQGKSWICSAKDLDWARHGFDGCKLGHLLMQIGRFNTGHRAMADVVSLIHLLAHRLDDGRTTVAHMLENAERPTLRVEATNAAFEKRGLLKARGYRWDPKARVWWAEIPPAELEVERLWLQQDIRLWTPPRVTEVTWHHRHR